MLCGKKANTKGEITATETQEDEFDWRVETQEMDDIVRNITSAGGGGLEKVERKKKAVTKRNLKERLPGGILC